MTLRCFDGLKLALLTVAALEAAQPKIAFAEEPIPFDRTIFKEAVTNVVAASDAPESVENTKTIKIRARKIAAKIAPNSYGSTEFYLYAGMEIEPMEKINAEGNIWIRFEIGGESFWLNETENAPAEEQQEKPRGYKILIRKSSRTLVLLSGNGQKWEEKETIPIGLGALQETAGRKKQKGDGKTPEGRYYVSLKNPASVFGKNARGGPLGSLYVGYPNAHDALAAWQEGRIDQETYRRIARAIERKETPPMDTDLGNYIMIHGGGASDWTAGCIALNDEDMERLYQLAKEGTPIEIEP